MTLKSTSPKKPPNRLKRFKELRVSLGKFLSKLRVWSGYTRFWIILSVILGVVGLASLPKPNVLVAASVQTETLEMTVSRSDGTSIFLPTARLEVGDDIECHTDLIVSPHQNTKVYYSRESASLSIAIDGNFSWRSKDKRAGADEFAIISVSNDFDTCSSSLPIRLPISGLMNIGTVAAAVSGDDATPLVILNGNLDIYGRAADRIFGIPVSVFSSFLPMEPDRLYLADQIKIPAGSSLASGTAHWGGFADVLWGQSNRGLRLEASTNARTLQLQAPAPRVSSNGDTLENQKADVISLTFGARLNKDPNIRWVFAAVSFLCLILGVFFQLPATKE